MINAAGPMNSPALLIVVPTLNSHHFLPRLLRSLQKQTWTHWRLLFIDGPSRLEHRNWLVQCCRREPRCTWVAQRREYVGIFGAMNQGFSLADANDWLLFWGSDDWAASSHVLAELASSIVSPGPKPDLVVCRARYANFSTEVLGRSTSFLPPNIYHSNSYRRALWLGCSPPHQATLFGPGARLMLSNYDTEFRLSADLDYFLKFGRYRGLSVQCLDLELVHMADGGVSSQQTSHRLQEVSRAYRRAYGWSWLFPFLVRYVRRLFSLV